MQFDGDKYLLWELWNIIYQYVPEVKLREGVDISLTENSPKLCLTHTHHYLLHPDEINWEEFAYNTDDMAVEKVKDHLNKYLELLKSYRHEEYMVKLYKELIDEIDEININDEEPEIDIDEDDYIEHLEYQLDELEDELSEFDKVWVTFSTNPNNAAVSYIINNIEHANDYSMQYNTNDIMIQYIIDNDLIYAGDFIFNTGDKAIKHMIENNIRITELSNNPNDLAVSYLFDNPEVIDWRLFSCNENPRVIRYLLEHPDKINHDVFVNRDRDQIKRIIEKYNIDYKGDLMQFRKLDVDYLIKHPEEAKSHIYKLGPHIYVEKTFAESEFCEALGF